MQPNPVSNTVGHAAGLSGIALAETEGCVRTCQVTATPQPDLQLQRRDENTILDLDKERNIVGITMEHASTRTDVSNLQLSGIAIPIYR